MRLVNFFFIALFLFAFSSCGIITKTRYGNGFKMDMSSNKAQGADSAYIKKYITNKKKYTVQTKNASSLPRQSKTEPTDANLASLQNKSLNADESELKSSLVQGNMVVNHPHKNNRVVNPLNISPSVSGSKDDPKPKIEPHAKAAAYLFYGGILLAGLILLIPALSILSILVMLALLVGYILAIIGVFKIKEATSYDGEELRGKGIAISIIVLYSLGLIAYFIALLYIILVLF